MKEAGNRRPLEDADHALDVAFVVVEFGGDAYFEKAFLLGCASRSCSFQKSPTVQKPGLVEAKARR